MCASSGVIASTKAGEHLLISMSATFALLNVGRHVQHMLYTSALLQASQQVQQAWANVKGKEPLNKRASTLASSNSNAADRLQRQPTSSNSDPAQSSANSTERQQSRRDSRDSVPANAQVHHAEQRNSAGNSGGGSFAGQSGYGQLQGSLNGGQLAAALSAGTQQGLNASSSQMPFAGQGTAMHATPSSTQRVHDFVLFRASEKCSSVFFSTLSQPAEGKRTVLSPEHMPPVLSIAMTDDCIVHTAISNQMVSCT